LWPGGLAFVANYLLKSSSLYFGKNGRVETVIDENDLKPEGFLVLISGSISRERGLRPCGKRWR